MTTHELAHTVATMLREGRFAEVQERYWSDDILAVEPMGPMARLKGREAVAKKIAYWNSTTEMHGCTVDGPFINGEDFALRLDLDVMQGQPRQTMREVVLYKTADGKIAEEHYLYAM